MKVILLQDVARVGARFDVKEVPSGHAQNYLIPRKLATPATAENLKRVEAMKSRQAKDTASRDAAFAAALEKLSGTKVEILTEANEQGHLFKGIKADDIVLKLAEMEIEVSRDQVILDAVIKEVGEHKVTLSSGDMEGVFTVAVAQK